MSSLMQTEQVSKRLRWKLRVVLGGAACGTLGGILFGATIGVILGLFRQTWVYGLDGAVLGGGIGAGLGALAALAIDWGKDSENPHVEIAIPLDKIRGD